MRLTNFEIRNAKPDGKAYKLTDGGGLYLLIQPNGSKLWRLKYRFLGKERLLAFGAYPLFSLAEARAKRDEAKKLLASGVDPGAKKKLERIAAENAAKNTFGVIAAEFLEAHEAKGSAETTKAKVRWLLTEVAAPIASRPVTEITSAELLELLKRVERSGRRETAKRLRATISAVFRLAIVTLRADRDPTIALKGALVAPNVRHRDVPLSRQARTILDDVWPLSDYGDLVFPSIRSNRRPLSENAMNSALRRMGFSQEEMTSHGFRSTASTILNERGVRPDVIEAMLGHQNENVVRRAYNRASYWPERVELMQQWADMLDEFRRL
jgi:integrase